MFQGLSVSPGIAVGRAVIIRFGGLPAFRRAVPPEELEKEERRLRRSAARAAEDFARHSRESKGDMGSELAAILEAHGLIAEDETFLGAIAERIRRDHVNAEWALAEVTRELSARLAAADSSAMREREADIADVAREISGHLTGGDARFRRSFRGARFWWPTSCRRPTRPSTAPRPGARARARRADVARASIIARLLRLPAVVGIPGLCDEVSPTADRGRRRPGTVDTNPSKERLRRSLERVREEREEKPPAPRSDGSAAATRDGLRIAVRANLELPRRFRRSSGSTRRASASSAPVSVPAGSAELARRRRAARGVRDLLEAAAPHPVRATYDLGGEKHRPAPGDNPASACAACGTAGPSELFDQQLLALCLASRRAR